MASSSIGMAHSPSLDSSALPTHESSEGSASASPSLRRSKSRVTVKSSRAGLNFSQPFAEPLPTAGWSQFASPLQSPAPSWRGHTTGYGFGGGFPPSNPSFTPSNERRDPFASYAPSVNQAMTPSASQSKRNSGASGSQHSHTNSADAQRQPATNPFGASTSGFSQSSSHNNLRKRQFFKSHVLQEGAEIHKPWLESKARKRADRKAYWVFVAACILGVLGSVGVIYSAVATLPNYKYCLVMQDDFSGTELNTKIWHRDQQVGGFGTGEFEWTTDSTNNSYVKDGSLYIVPTLTSDSLGEAAITNGYTLNLTANGKCTAANISDPIACSVASNSSTGVVLPPVQSARLITNFSTTIKYGRIEVRAKMPTGDWIWPAIWMMPKDSVYGAWPKSGEIDIFESKGNKVTKKDDDFSNRMHSSMHWGLSAGTDRYLETTKDRQLYRKYYDQEYHTFGLEWTPKGIYTWEQSPIHKVLAYNWATDFYTKGQFPVASANGTVLENPWPKKATAAPFDQEFYLILSVAVGGTNGYFFEDTMPWSNNGQSARADFWKARKQWLPTWPEKHEDRAMIVDYVKMYQLDGEEGKACPAQPLIG